MGGDGLLLTPVSSAVPSHSSPSAGHARMAGLGTGAKAGPQKPSQATVPLRATWALGRGPL